MNIEGVNDAATTPSSSSQVLSLQICNRRNLNQRIKIEEILQNINLKTCLDYSLIVINRFNLNKKNKVKKLFSFFLHLYIYTYINFKELLNFLLTI